MVMSETVTSLDLSCVNAIRALSIDAVQKANSGHPGLPLGAAPMAYVLWTKFLKHNPSDPHWPDRDRFVLSAGHGSMLIYSLLHLTGYKLSLDDLKAFRQWGAKTPGHPERGVAPGVEATTGPLGQGTANAVGMAIAERFLANRYNKDGHEVVDHWTYALVGDGDMMEGITSETASLAGHLKLGKLVFLYDANDVSLDGPNSLTFTEDVGARYAAYGWQVLHVADGDGDLAAIEAALTEAKADTTRPSLIIVKTTIGFGSPNKAGTSDAHGSPLGPDEVKRTKEALGLDPKATFSVPEEALAHLRQAVDQGQMVQKAWSQRLEAWGKAHKALAAEWERITKGDLPPKWEEHLPTFEAGKKLATRESGHALVNAIATAVPNFFGGDADLSCSTKTAIKDGGDFDGATGAGRNIRYGVREHAMGAIANGIAYHGGVRTFTATFFVFSDYMRPAMRLAAMNHLPVTFVFTHDSIGVGEDGPTHQPVEHLASLRAMPGLVVIRPCDATEVTEAWRFAMKEKKRPTALVLSRQGLPTLDRTTHGAAAGLHKGAYILSESKGAMRAVLIASGSEVELVLEAQAKLHELSIPTRVVSMPSWELFEDQPDVYQESIIPPEVGIRVSIEAGATFGWQRWLGPRGVAIGLDRYGASAPAEKIYEELGITSSRVVETVQKLIGAPPPTL
jgi:transketolase